MTLPRLRPTVRDHLKQVKREFDEALKSCVSKSIAECKGPPPLSVENSEGVIVCKMLAALHHDCDRTIKPGDLAPIITGSVITWSFSIAPCVYESPRTITQCQKVLGSSGQQHQHTDRDLPRAPSVPDVLDALGGSSIARGHQALLAPGRHPHSQGSR